MKSAADMPIQRATASVDKRTESGEDTEEHEPIAGWCTIVGSEDAQAASSENGDAQTSEFKPWVPGRLRMSYHEVNAVHFSGTANFGIEITWMARQMRAL